MICGKDQEMSSIGRMKSVNQTQQAGKNTLSNFMTDISKFGNLSREYSNRSVMVVGAIS